MQMTRHTTRKGTQIEVENRDPRAFRPGQRTQPIKMVLMLGAFLLAILYGTIAFTSGDFFWFLKGFHSRPARIIVYYDEGKRTELLPGAPGFDLLASAIQDSRSEGLERPSGIGLSDASLLDAYSRYVTVEAFFARPVQLHAWFETGQPTRMLFPITGRHSDLSLVVLGQGEKYLSSPPVLKTIEPLRDALRQLGYTE
jgi:hypothetical protein